MNDFQRGLYGGAMEALNALQAGDLAQLPLLILSALGFGMLHAWLPGHGKTTLAAYHAGQGGWRDALASSVVIILTHVGSAVLIVLAGFSILKRTIGGAGRAPQLELASHMLVLLVGLWLLWRAFRPHRHVDHRSGLGLAFVAGLVPCPLTTFIMTYAATKGAIAAGLILSGAFALGMIVTVALFPLFAVLARTRLALLLAGSSG